jgi:methyltransferase family protein
VNSRDWLRINRLVVVHSDRYIAFLLSTLPKLASRRLYSPKWPLPMRRFAVLDQALRGLRRRPGIALEFGVYRGASLRHSARRCPDRTFYGFDSFNGFPSDGRPDWQIDFATSALPRVPPNCRLIPGWFSETIPAFLRETPSPIGFINIDCDIYSSARAVLFGLGERLLPGTVIYFDELINYDVFLWNEMLALFEFLEVTGFGIEWIAAHCRIRGLDEVFSHYEAGYYPSWREDDVGGYRRPAAAVLTRNNDDLGLLQSRSDAGRIGALTAKFEHFTERYEAMRPRATTMN